MIQAQYLDSDRKEIIYIFFKQKDVPLMDVLEKESLSLFILLSGPISPLWTILRPAGIINRYAFATDGIQKGQK